MPAPLTPWVRSAGIYLLEPCDVFALRKPYEVRLADADIALRRERNLDGVLHLLKVVLRQIHPLLQNKTVNQSEKRSVWMLRAIVWMVRAIVWMVRAIVWMVRGQWER